MYSLFFSLLLFIKSQLPDTIPCFGNINLEISGASPQRKQVWGVGKTRYITSFTGLEQSGKDKIEMHSKFWGTPEESMFTSAQKIRW